MPGETIWHLPRQTAGPDAHGNPVWSWPAAGEPDAVAVDGVFVAPRTDLAGEAAIADREAVVTNVRLIAPAGTRIDAVDRLEVRGELYEVVGEPAIFVLPWSGVEAGVDISAKRTAG